MIKKTFLACCVLLLLYSFTIKVWNPKPVSQHHWQRNAIKAQDFIYKDPSGNFPNIIVGSSLSSSINTDSLNGFYNLSFTGQGIFDGLHILDQQEQVPKNVFIEINKVFRQEDEYFTSSQLNSFWHFLKQHDPALRDGKQPLGLAGNYLAQVIGKEETNTNAEEILIDSSLDITLQKLLQNNIAVYSKGPEAWEMQRGFAFLHTYIESLQRKGCRIIFFEMPVHQSLCNLLEPNQIRNAFKEHFPPDQYTYIPQPECAGYRTYDGMHLTNKDAKQYTDYFKGQLKKINIISAGTTL